MNLMDLASAAWWPPALDATAPDLLRRLPAIAPSSAIAGRLSRHWQFRHGLPAAKVAVWSGDNPCSLDRPRPGARGTRWRLARDERHDLRAHARRRASTPAAPGTCSARPPASSWASRCSATARWRASASAIAIGLTWDGFSRALETTPPGNGGALMLPWFEPEITPAVAAPGVRRRGLDEHDAAANVRAVVEAQMMALALHSRWMGVAGRRRARDRRRRGQPRRSCR